jgi:hypothetical protein
MNEQRPREFHEALLDADAFEDLSGNWQAAIVAAERTGRRFGSLEATSPRSRRRRRRYRGRKGRSR